MRGHQLSNRERFGPRLIFLERFDVGRRWRRRRAHDALQDPRSSKHGRGPVRIRRHHQHGTLSEQTPAGGIVELDAAEPVTLDRIDVVVERQPFVKVGVVGREQLKHTAVLAEHAVDEQPELGAEVIPRIAGKGKHRGIGIDLGELRHVEPLESKVTGQRLRAAIRKQTTHLRFEHRRVAQAMLLREPQQLCIGNAAPQEEGEPRGEFEIVDPIDVTGDNVAGRQLGAVQKIGARKNGGQRAPHAAFKITGITARRVEFLDRREFGFRDRPPESPLGQRHEDAIGTGLLLRR